MKKSLLIILCIGFLIPQLKAQLTGAQLLKKAIKYHDPKGQWDKLEQSFFIEESRPDGSMDTVHVYLNNRKGFFSLIEIGDTLSKVYEFRGEECRMVLNGSEEISEENAKKYRMTPRFAKIMRNYYTYLWGLPMKLKDPGTIIHEVVDEEVFQGLPCYKLKVTYEEGVGKDIWYFYFKKDTYALHGYKFHKDESKNDGEYITIEGEEKYSKMRIPKSRKWYYNKDGKFLGEDTILSEKDSFILKSSK